MLRSKKRKIMSSNECQLSRRMSEAKADITWVKVDASLRLTYTIFHTLSFKNSTWFKVRTCARTLKGLIINQQNPKFTKYESQFINKKVNIY